MLAQIVHHLLINTLGCSAQRKFAQCGKIANLQKIIGRPRGVFGKIDLAFLKALNQFIGCNVDHHNISSIFDDRIGHKFTNLNAGDGGHNIGKAFDVLDIQRSPYIDTRVQQFINILKTFRVT